MAQAGQKREVTFDQWEEEGVALYGENRAAWRFKCPLCGYIASMADWHKLGADSSIATSCTGRFTTPPSRNGMNGIKKGEPCNYAGYGLFKLNPVVITDAPLQTAEDKIKVKEDGKETEIDNTTFELGRIEVFEFAKPEESN